MEKNYIAECSGREGSFFVFFKFLHCFTYVLYIYDLCTFVRGQHDGFLVMEICMLVLFEVHINLAYHINDCLTNAR